MVKRKKKLIKFRIRTPRGEVTAKKFKKFEKAKKFKKKHKIKGVIFGE